MHCTIDETTVQQAQRSKRKSSVETLFLRLMINTTWLSSKDLLKKAKNTCFRLSSEKVKIPDPMN